MLHIRLVHGLQFTLFSILTFFAVRPASAIVNGELDGNRHANVGTFVVPGGIDLDGDGIPDEDLNWDGLPDVPSIWGNCTLIHPRVAIFAGHVGYAVQRDLQSGLYTLDELKVSFSPNPKMDPGSWLDVAEIIVHPDYVDRWDAGLGATPLVDVALVILKNPAANIVPASLAPRGFLDTLKASGLLGNKSNPTKFTVVGYGIFGAAPNHLLRPDGQRREAQSEYLLLLDRWLYLDQNAVHDNGGTANLDSGGPTFWRDPATGDEILVSMTSKGDAAFVATGVTYRVDTDEALDFIEFVLGLVSAAMP